MLRFLSLFVISIIGLTTYDGTMNIFFFEADPFRLSVFSFLLMHCIVLTIYYEKRETLWWVLTLFHGLAHIVYPAFINDVPNINYNPLPFFIIHTLGCLLISSRYRYFFTLSVLFVGFLESMYREFLFPFLRRLIYLCGILGVQNYALYLRNDRELFYASFLNWYLPYIGYINNSTFSQWNIIIDGVGLFRWWFLAYYLALKLHI